MGLNRIKSNKGFVVRSIQRNRGLLRITTIKYKKIKPIVLNIKFLLTTVNVCFGQVDGETVQFALWDTAGQEDYEQLRPLSYPNTDVIVICFSIDNRDSFANVSLKWIPEVRHFCPRTPIVLVGTKTDLRYNPGAAYSSSSDKRPVGTSEGTELSRYIKAHRYVECSAKTRDGVDEVFQSAAKASMFPSRPKRHKRFCVTL